MRHPMAEKLHLLRMQLKATKNPKPADIRTILELAQLEVEKEWDAGWSGWPMPPGPSRCGEPGCNYRRYPASKFCMYHVTGHDTFAAQLRRAENRERRAAAESINPAKP